MLGGRRVEEREYNEKLDGLCSLVESRFGGENLKMSIRIEKSYAEASKKIPRKKAS